MIPSLRDARTAQQRRARTHDAAHMTDGDGHHRRVGEVGDAQLGAFTMAVCCRGMTVGETSALTRAMRDSGAVLDLAGFEPWASSPLW